jgi:hypothetical protein
MTPRFQFGRSRLRDDERRQLQKLSRELIELEVNHYRVTESRLTRAHSPMRKIDRGGGMKIAPAFFDRTAVGGFSS